ncbi:MAG: dihydroorotate dehydrogenase electron transfer subunit [Candidatus Omnitrophica bacterium]|nr:dihydroorotate dehydrogenase electron transfer subunit [Candidatus Omnitrophota bacterium]
MMLETGKIRENHKAALPYYYRMVIEVPEHFQALPGQFLQIQIESKTTDPLLRRPFSIAGLSRNRVTVFYQVKGKGTILLSRLQAGDSISLLGPLGKPYPAVPGPKIILAGGLGAAGLLFLAKNLSLGSQNKKSVVLLGCKTKEDLFLLDNFQDLGIPTYCATEDGSFGFKGLATSLLTQKIKKIPGKGTLYACGPNPMLAMAGKIAAKHGWSAYFSMETMMACGIGLCRGCAVATINGYRLACVDGPVFPAEEIIWGKLPPHPPLSPKGRGLK